MKQKLTYFTMAALAVAASQACAQGLLSIGQNTDLAFERKFPLTWIVGAQVGYDSNPAVSGINNDGSATISASIEALYASGDRRTALNYRASYSPLWYLDAPPNRDDFQQSVRVGVDFRRRINPRLTVTNSFYAAYEVQPDYQIGATSATSADPYFYAHNSTALAYSWTRRFSTVTSYSIHGVWYDGVGDDYLVQTLANEFRYALSRTTTLALTYRYATSDFDMADDYDSHYVLAGVDHRFNPRLSGSVRVGAEFREGDSTPYTEASVIYLASKKTDIRWYSTYGFSNNGTSVGADANFRTGLTASHRINSRLSGSVGLHYIPQGDGLNEQDVVAASLGVNYVLYRNISLNAGYNYTNASSDNPFLDFDRHQFQLGVGSRF